MQHEDNFSITGTISMSFRGRIEEAYQRSGNTLGWRFLYSPPETLARASVAFIGLNPGGSVEEDIHGRYAMERGSAYSHESWAGCAPSQHPLQKQVLSLFAKLEIEPEEVLAGNLVPFRSRDWKSLKSRKQSVQFGKELWTEALQTSQPPLIVTMGALTTKILSEMLDIRHLEKHPTGWGKVSAFRGEFEGGRLVGLPHLSRFSIMTRPQSSFYTDRVLT
ncbi:uracil-DNA glycosylase family protein [Pseudooceanicola algae]|uniref:Uracil-DNA glycosylase-like domain-containing protein n=1 Tax=Pseudooceanicola algae TaxID=1537215 RepID=A0A418SLF7_9RHOB|nr:uracil-DNA glycosylase family protein [Pseudooceanicola algae]QPM90834.1 hypothetical protein PSAL_020760 [Pseudooceanicola algae]